MPHYCVAGNCYNAGGNGKDISMHPFPHNKPDLLMKWVEFVQVKRTDFTMPTKHSHLCNDHFVRDDYDNLVEFEMGFTKKRRLKPDAVPTLHKNPRPRPYPWPRLYATTAMSTTSSTTTSAASAATTATGTSSIAEMQSKNVMRTKMRKVCIGQPSLTKDPVTVKVLQLMEPGLSEGSLQISPRLSGKKQKAPERELQALAPSFLPAVDNISPAARKMRRYRERLKEKGLYEEYRKRRSEVLKQSRAQMSEEQKQQKEMTRLRVQRCCEKKKEAAQPLNKLPVLTSSAEETRRQRERERKARYRAGLTPQKRIAINAKQRKRAREKKEAMSRMVSVSLANDKKTRKPPGSSQEGPQAGVQKAAPQQKSFVMRQGTVILQLDSGTKKFIPVTVDLPQLPAVPGSGQECRQPVLQSSGPASSESLGPQSCQSACAPYPVMLIGPREKSLLSRVYPVKARSPEEGESQSSLQVTQASQECAAVPVKVKLEEAEDSVASCQEAGDVHQTPQEFEVKVKVEPVEEEDGTQCFEKREMDQISQEFAMHPVEVKAEPDMDYSDTVVQVKTEPPEDNDIKCFEKQEMDPTPQDFAVLPVEVKVEPDMKYSDTLVEVKTEPPENYISTWS